MSFEANTVAQPASAAIALQTSPTTSNHSPGANNAALGNFAKNPNPIGETILPARTVTKIESNPSKSRKKVTFTANVISDSGKTPKGTVMFKHGTKNLWAEAPLNHGTTSIVVKMVEVRGVVSAIYSGDHHHASSSDVLVQTSKSNSTAAQTSNPPTQAQGSPSASVASNHPPLAMAADPSRALPEALNQHELFPVTGPTNRDVWPSANHATAQSTNHASVNAAGKNDLESTPETLEVLATSLTYTDGKDGELTFCIAKPEDVEKETALTGEITKLWYSHEWSKSSLRRSRTELERLRDQLAERLNEYKSLLVRTGRNGKWMGFLREANIPRTTADRLVAKSQLSKAPGPVKRTNGALEAFSKAEIEQMVKKLKPKLVRVLTTPDTVALFMTELAAALQPPTSVG